MPLQIGRRIDIGEGGTVGLQVAAELGKSFSTQAPAVTTTRSACIISPLSSSTLPASARPPPPCCSRDRHRSPQPAGDAGGNLAAMQRTALRREEGVAEGAAAQERPARRGVRPNNSKDSRPASSPSRYSSASSPAHATCRGSRADRDGSRRDQPTVRPRPHRLR